MKRYNEDKIYTASWKDSGKEDSFLLHVTCACVGPLGEGEKAMAETLGKVYHLLQWYDDIRQGREVTGHLINYMADLDPESTKGLVFKEAQKKTY